VAKRYLVVYREGEESAPSENAPARLSWTDLSPPKAGTRVAVVETEGEEEARALWADARVLSVEPDDGEAVRLPVQPAADEPKGGEGAPWGLDRIDGAPPASARGATSRPAPRARARTSTATGTARTRPARRRG
jgi:hypothetical protein